MTLLRVLRAFVVSLFSTKRAGIQKVISKILKKFSPSLTPYPIRIYLFSAFLATSAVNTFFEPNAQLRPIIERRYFSAPRSEYGIFILLFWVLCSEFCVLFLWIGLWVTENLCFLLGLNKEARVFRDSASEAKGHRRCLHRECPLPRTQAEQKQC